MHTSGGRVSININGLSYSARGEIKINPSGLTADVGTNQDGTLYKTIKPKPISAECTFDRFVDVNGTPLKWNKDLMLLNNIPITFTEQDTGKQQLLTNGTFVGDPQIDLSTGEVSGVSLAAEKYEEI
jgi:hypothetical protein